MSLKTVVLRYLTRFFVDSQDLLICYGYWAAKILIKNSLFNKKLFAAFFVVTDKSTDYDLRRYMFTWPFFILIVISGNDQRK